MATFNFCALPRELRDEIYAYTLAIGCISILSISRQTYMEAKSLLYKEATYRIHFRISRMFASGLGGPRVSGPGQLDEDVQRKIENLQIEWVLPAWSRSEAQFDEGGSVFAWDRTLRRNFCCISIRVEPVSVHVLFNGLEIFEKLAGFETVLLRIDVVPLQEGSSGYSRERMRLFLRWWPQVVRMVYYRIERVLGPAVDPESAIALRTVDSAEDVKPTCFVFHPWTHLHPPDVSSERCQVGLPRGG